MVIRIPDYSKEEKDWTELEPLYNSDIDNRPISELCRDNLNLLVFPKDLGKYYHDGLDEKGKYICKIYESKEGNGKGVIETWDLLGFVGCKGTELTIRSRFAKDERGENDFFLHYVVQKVLNINLFKLPHSSAKDKVFDFLVCLFPLYLKEALGQGMYKQYVVRRYNDSNVRGTIDVARHIKMNIPFSGKFAYNVREYSHDNNMTQLIRHTIEHIRTTIMSGVLRQDADTESYVAQIREATPSYKKQDRTLVISKNLKSPTHPYFHKYIALQELCIKILTHKKLKFGNDDEPLYGLLFSGSWLWEEYLYKAVLKDCGFVHPENKAGKGAIYLFANNRLYDRYPDYYEKDSVVLDAKYKRMLTEKGNPSVGRDDMHQVITYIHVLKTDKGGFIHPYQDSKGETIKQQKLGTLNGYGGEMYVISVPIPYGADSYEDFKGKMETVEVNLLDTVQELAKTHIANETIINTDVGV